MDDQFKSKLSPEQIRILVDKGTERPFTGEYLDNKEDGIYRCAACSNELFDSKTKYNSGSGWPSFTDVINKGNLELLRDTTHGMIRVEVVCSNCGGHLGHVFEDGPDESTGLRYCINSASLDFDSREKE